jgi:hypothetical protein
MAAVLITLAALLIAALGVAAIDPIRRGTEMPWSNND